MIGEVLERADDRRDVGGKVFGFQRDAIRRQDELDAVAGVLRGRALAQRADRVGDLPLRANLDVDIVDLENAAEVGLVRRAAAQPFDRGRLVAERFEEREGEFLGVERLTYGDLLEEILS